MCSPNDDIFVIKVASGFHTNIKLGLRRSSDSQITVADLTGVAVQDIQISKLAHQVLTNR